MVWKFLSREISNIADRGARIIAQHQIGHKLLFARGTLHGLDDFLLDWRKIRQRTFDLDRLNPVAFNFDLSRDFPNQTDFPGYSSLWDTANCSSAFQGCQNQMQMALD